MLECVDDADRDLAKLAEKAVLRAKEYGPSALIDRLTRGDLRASWLRLLGKMNVGSDKDGVIELLVTAAAHEDVKVRRAALRALGKLGDERAEPALIAALPRCELPEQRVIVEALGKVGGAAALAAILQLSPSDPELQRLATRARLMLERSHGREQTTIRLDQPLPSLTQIAGFCRPGLASLLASELPGAQRRTESEVTLRAQTALRELLQARVALEFALLYPLGPGADLGERVSGTLSERAAIGALHAWSSGAPRFRLSFVGGGHRRRDVWAIAERLRTDLPNLINDPRGSSWEFRINESEARLELLPRAFVDPRFAYRRLDVPAASHPTIAAALARVCAPKPADVVWDPFCGSGLELVECGLLCKGAQLVGSDLSATALDAARANLQAAGMRGRLHVANALLFAPKNVTAIVSNPPMGRRIARGQLGQLLEKFVAHAQRVLRPGGRLVWLSPLPQQTAATGRTLGFDVERREPVDLGGFRAELQILQKHA